jgi:predicted acylesterase/phospholipase RssA
MMDSGLEIVEATGTSGGAIIAAALGCGFDEPESLRALMSHAVLKRSYWDVSLNPFRSKGLFKGRKFLDLFRHYFDRRLGDTDIPIKIIALELSDFDLEGSPSYKIFGSEETPDVMVYDAVRASMAIPIVFTPHRIEGKLYVDGGVTASFPLDIYGAGEDVVGIRMLGQGKVMAPRGWFSFFSYARWLVEATAAALDREHIDDAIHARMIYVRTKSPALRLTHDRSSIESLWAEGYSAFELHDFQSNL